MNIFKKFIYRHDFCHFNDSYDILIDDIILNPVHMLPEVFAENQSVDYYMNDNKDIYLITFENSVEDTIQFTINTLYLFPINDICIKTNIVHLNEEELISIIRTLKSIGYRKHFKDKKILRKLKVIF